jgi:hypothetical protein
LYFRRSRGHAAASDANNPTGLTEEEEEEEGKYNKMVTSTFILLGIATVDDGEVIPVSNTPPQPRPLPEPPPPSNGFIEKKNNADSYQGFHSVTSTDGEKLPFRLMSQVEGQAIGKYILQCKQQTTKQGAKKNAELGVYMIEADGYTSESDASAYSEATYGYDADDDTCDDASVDEGNGLTVSAAASRQRQPPSGGILKKKKDLPRKSELPAADPRRFLANKATPVRNKKDGKIIMQLVVVLYQDKYKTIQPFHSSTTALATAPATAPDAAPDTATTATIRRPLSSTVPGLASGYSTTTVNDSGKDGEEKLLFRSMNRVVNYNNNDDTIAILQLVFYQDKYVLPSDNRYGYSTTTIDGELIFLFRLVYRVNRMY